MAQSATISGALASVVAVVAAVQRVVVRRSQRVVLELRIAVGRLMQLRGPSLGCQANATEALQQRCQRASSRAGADARRITVGGVHVVSITAADTRDLRLRVLRDGTASDAVEFDGDHDRTTFHLGVRDTKGALVATSTWLARRHAKRPSQPAHQLRGMAIEPALQGAGVGAQLLLAGLAACAAAGSEVVWAHARSSALGFYERHGFVVCGEEYVEDATGLAHVDVVRAVGVRTLRPD